jgi:hypothetical protein
MYGVYVIAQVIASKKEPPGQTFRTRRLNFKLGSPNYIVLLSGNWYVVAEDG